MSAAAVAALSATVALADHSWGGYHWATSGSGLTLDVGDNVSSTWDAYLDEAIVDWNKSSWITLIEVLGGANPKNCRPTAGRIEVCSSRYGNNGWLGIAQIWLSGGHISQAITKVNDTYFNTATYNTPAWRRLVMCQEIAHDFGLDHQDETFANANLGSCMDYTNDPDGGSGGAVNNDPSNEHPNTHDYDQIASIYNHGDGGAKAAAIDSDAPDHPSQWGRLLRQNEDRRIQVFELDLGNGRKMLTHVYWADPDRDARGNRGQ
jgi:hypothetical protein